MEVGGSWIPQPILQCPHSFKSPFCDLTFSSSELSCLLYKIKIIVPYLIKFAG